MLIQNAKFGVKKISLDFQPIKSEKYIKDKLDSTVCNI